MYVCLDRVHSACGSSVYYGHSSTPAFYRESDEVMDERKLSYIVSLLFKKGIYCSLDDNGNIRLMNTNLTLDKNSITVSSESNNVATLNVNFPTRSTAQLPEDLSADMKIECLNKSFSPNTQIIIDLFWDDKYSTFTYRIDKECNYVWLSDILSINYGERPLLKELWRNLNTVKISYVLPDEATLNTDISVIAFDGQEIEIGNHVDLEIRVDQSSEINKVLTNRDLCYYCKESGMIVIKHKEFAPCQIYDLTGKLLHEVPSGQTTIDASSWAKGLYIVKAGNQIAKIAVN